MRNIILIIGTGGLPKDEILYLQPEFNAPANYKDSAKIQEWKARKAEEWLLDAPNSALSGRVLAIAYQRDGMPCKVIDDEDESVLLEKFWNVFRENPDCNFVGFNSRNWGIPFLVRRSWKNRVIVPRIFQGRFLNWNFIDIAQIWGCGNAEKVSLNTLVKFFGVKGDQIDENIKFSAMWEVGKDAAKDWLKHGIALTRAVGEAMNVIDTEGDANENGYRWN